MIYIPFHINYIRVYGVDNRRWPGYTSTVHKVMGQAVEHVTLVFDMRMLSPAVGYVALSRVSCLDNVAPLLPLKRSRFINIDY